MAKRGISGQINMFDFFSGDNAGGEVEMVSLFPGDEPFEDISDGDDGLASGIQEFGEVKKEPEAKPEPGPEKKVETKPEPKAEPKKPVADKPKPIPKAKAEPKPEPKTEEPVAEKPKPTPKAKAEPKPEPKAEEPVAEKPKQDAKTEPEVKSEPKVKPRLTKLTIDDSAPVMHKEILDDKGKVIGQIAFRNYNRVCLQLPGEEMKEYQFNSSKEAVDFYMGEIWKLTKEE